MGGAAVNIGSSRLSVARLTFTGYRHVPSPAPRRKSSTRKNGSRPLPGGGSGRLAGDAHGGRTDEGKAEPGHLRRGSDRSSRGQEPIAAGQAAFDTTRRYERHRRLR